MKKDVGFGGGNGELQWLDGIYFNITERKQVEAELKTYRENLEKLVTDRTAELKVSNEILMQEIKERKQAEEELQKREELFMSIFEQSAVGISQIDIKTGQLLRVNQRFCDIFDYTKDEMTAKTFMKITHPDDLKQDLENMKKLIAGEIREFSMEKRYLHKNGSTVWGKLFVSPMWDVGQEPNYHIAVIEDITERKQAKEKFDETERMNRSLLEGAPVCNKIIDKDFKLQYMSAAGVTALKVPDVNLCYGKDYPFHFFCHESRIAITEKLKIAFTGKTAEIECPTHDMEGNEFWFVHTFVPVFDDDGQVKYLIGSSVDITKRKQAEEALREGEAKYRRLVENLGREYFLYSKDPSGVFTYVSPSVTKMLGHEQEEFMKHFPEYLTDNPINEEVGIKSGQSIKGIRQPPYLLETYHKDGGSRLLEVNEVPILGVDGKVVSVEGIAHDLSERKMAEQERLRLSTAIEQAGEAIVITDIDGNIQYVNPAFRFITGYSDKEAIGQNPKILQSGKHSDSFYEQMWDTLMREQVWKGHFVNKKKDGSLYDEEATISPVKNTAGNICNFVAVKRDVTQEIQKEDQLRQAQKMESIGILAGGIAHDFNNILGAIVGYTELLIDDTPKSSPAQGYLNEILKSTGRANDLVKQILTFSRKTDQQNKPIKIIPIIKESLKLLRSTLPTTIEIRQRIDDFADVVIADPTQIHQIMMNLCTNASHAIQEENGLIDVQLTSATLTKNDLIGQKELKPGPYVKITVQDNGCGIDAANIDNIFDPFFTTKEVGRGTGMGLAVTHGIISNHDGFITVESSKAKGTTFDVFLPQAEIEAKQSEEYLEQIIKGTGNILFVDDEIALANIAKRMLSSLGYTVEVANDAFEALDIFNKDPARFDLVITDLTMPKMTGFNLAKRLFAIRANIPIILCSGFSESISEEDTKKIGIKAFVTKPLVTTKISKTIHAILSTQKE